MNYKLNSIFLSLIFFLLFSGCDKSGSDYDHISTLQDMNVPELDLAISAETKVLLVFAHPDDEVVCAGLITHFKKDGASVHLLTMTPAANTDENIQRVQEVACSARKLNMDKIEVAGIFNNTWEQVMSDSIVFWYDHQDSLKAIIRKKINLFQPRILVTFDTEIGGYGHPEHRISAALTRDVFDEYSVDTAYSPEMILQITLPEQLEQFLVAGKPGYDLALQRTGSKGLPNPDFALNIEKYWPLKDKAARCYVSQEKTLDKFYMMYKPENAEAHAKAFGREYYTLVKRQNLSEHQD